ncbi:MAG: ABC transporter ATP-binding protein/permease [Clostridiales bacterium]|nr:ABC transporter ATP-binding protein/permease [Clostridiales bacterium]
MRRRNWKKTRLLARHLRPAASALLLGMGASLLLTLLRMAFTQVIRFTVDGVLLGDASGLPAFAAQLSPGTQLAAACALAAAIALLQFGVSYIQDSRLPMGSERFVKSLRDALYSRIQRLPYSWHVQNSTGDIIQRCISDVEIVRAFVMDQLLELLGTLFMIVTCVVIMFTMNVKMALLATAFVPVIVGYSVLFFRHMSGRYEKADEAEGALSAVVQENLTGVRVVRAFGREKTELDKFREKNNRYTDLWLRLGDWMSAFYTLGDMMSILQVFAIVVLGVHLCVAGEVSLGVYLAFVSYTRELTLPVRRLGRTISEMSKANVSIDRLLYILESEEERSTESPAQADLHGEIRFEHVSFAYEEKRVLRDVSFSIPGGKTLGVFGGTGSGKSTIALLLARLYDPDTGRITIGGVDTKDMDLGELRRGVGVVLQEPFLFSRTLAENIAITREDATREDVERAAQDACLDASVGEFVNGYETIVGERGVTLSGGQKQRTAIARTLLSGAPVMVFDDALSAVDAKTDEAIRTRLRAAAGGATLILIAHRVATLMQADRIIVLEDGQIVESGTPDELLAQGGAFARAAAMQAAMGEEAQA